MKRSVRARALAGAQVIALVLTLALTLTGCGGMKPEQARTLVQGTLDEFYRGEFDAEYLKLVHRTEEEALANYRKNLSTEADKFAYYFHITYLDKHEGLRQEIIELYRDIYAQTRYSVQKEPEKENKSSYAVAVQVEPADIFQLVLTDFDRITDSYNMEFRTVNTATMTEEEKEALALEADAFWARAVVDLCREKLSQMGRLQPVTVTVRVTKDESGSWSISDADLLKINEALIDYPAVE